MVNSFTTGKESQVSVRQDRRTAECPLEFYLFEGRSCPYAARTNIVLEELGIPFELKFLTREQSKSPEYLAINPRGKVPALRNPVDGFCVYESAICNEYLSDLARSLDPIGYNPNDNKHCVWKLMPNSPCERAKLRLLNDYTETQLNSAFFTYLMNKDAEKESELLGALEQGLRLLERSLEESGGPYLMGQSFTLADVHVLPFFFRMKVSLEYFKGYTISKSKFSRVLDWWDHCRERDSVKAASIDEAKVIELYKRFIKVNYSFGGLNKN
jgi:glutathione S-transferase